MEHSLFPLRHPQERNKSSEKYFFSSASSSTPRSPHPVECITSSSGKRKSENVDQGGVCDDFASLPHAPAGLAVAAVLCNSTPESGAPERDGTTVRAWLLADTMVFLAHYVARVFVARSLPPVRYPSLSISSAPLLHVFFLLLYIKWLFQVQCQTLPSFGARSCNGRLISPRNASATRIASAN
jgi:hypothetical protein